VQICCADCPPVDSHDASYAASQEAIHGPTSWTQLGLTYPIVPYRTLSHRIPSYLARSYPRSPYHPLSDPTLYDPTRPNRNDCQTTGGTLNTATNKMSICTLSRYGPHSRHRWGAGLGEHMGATLQPPREETLLRPRQSRCNLSSQSATGSAHVSHLIRSSPIRPIYHPSPTTIPTPSQGPSPRPSPILTPTPTPTHIPTPTPIPSPTPTPTPSLSLSQSESEPVSESPSIPTPRPSPSPFPQPLLGTCSVATGTKNNRCSAQPTNHTSPFTQKHNL
jgi:hypothetical protein